MPKEYPQEAIKKCREYYVQFGGNGDEIEKAMRKDYPSWSKRYLFDKDDRLGWINKFGFEKSLELDQQKKIGAVQNDDDRRYRAVVELADRYQELALQGDEKAVPIFLKLVDQQIELRNKLDLTTANFETFVEDWDLIVQWASELDPELGKRFYKLKDEFIEKAVIHFGKESIDG